MRSVHPSQPDVVIVGARAGGAATAMLLARAGLDVVVVDRSAYGADTLSTHALIRAGVVQLHRWGLLDAVIAAGTPAVHQSTFTYANDVVQVAVKPAHGVGALYAPRRTVLDPIIVDAARRAGARVHFGTTVTDVIRDASGRAIGVDGLDAAGRGVRYYGRLVIGADGVRSVVARAVDAPVERQGTGCTAVVYGYWTDLDHDGYQSVYRPDAFAGLIPTNGGATCVFAAAQPSRIGRGGRDVFAEVVRAASPDLADRIAAATAPRAVRTFRGLPGFARRPWGPGWALVGDAGYWKDPISAHGLTDALRDAELLAHAVIATAAGNVSEGDAFGWYHQRRNRLSFPLFDVVDEIAGGRWTDAEIPLLLRRFSEAMSEEVDVVAGFDDLDGITGLGRLDREPALIGARS